MNKRNTTGILRKIGFILFAGIISTLSYSQEFYGKVINLQTGKPVEGAHIIVVGNHGRAISDAEGIYTLKVNKSGIYKIICTHIGYESVSVEVQIIENSRKEINFNLKELARELKEITVTAEITGPVRRTGDALYTGSSITSKGIELLGISAHNSVYNSLDLMPDVSVNGQDAYGLAEKEVRIRGIRGLFSGMTIEGFPNYGIMPIGARDEIYDMENMQSISLYKGAVPSDIGSATGSRGGTIELTYKRPQDKSGITINEYTGTDNYLKNFIRFNSGKLKTNTAVFASYSYSTANKWKGEGRLARRHNMALGITQQLTPKMILELFGNYNTNKRHHFRPLSYTEASDLKKYYESDYSGDLSGVPAEDYYYFDYNRGEYSNVDAMAIWNYNLSEKISLSTRVYYSREDALYQNTMISLPNYYVQDRTRDIDRTGIMPEARGEAGKLSYSAGYWFESFDNRVYIYNTSITSGGLVPKGYSFYTLPVGRGKIHSPYAKLAYNGEHFKFQAGLKYYYFNEPESERYKSVTPDTLSSEPIDDLHTDAIIQSAVLPSFGIGYSFSEAVEIYANYGRNYMRPYQYVPTISLYLSRKSAFNNAGMNLQSVFDTWKMETSDNFDLGLHYTHHNIKISPTFYYSKHYNVLADVYDARVDINYSQNAGNLTAYGAEVETYLYPFRNLTIYINPAYSIMFYNENLKKLIGSDVREISIKGKQTPATPIWSAKSGILYTHGFLMAAARVNYTGKRFGDATNLEKIPRFTVVDLSLQFKKGNILFTKELAISCEVKNLFNKKYIGMISVSDDSMAGKAAYYAGAPRTIVAAAKISF